MKLYSYRCDHCGKLHYPKYYVCQDCGYRSFTPVPLGGKCTLVTWTRLYSLPTGFTEPWRNYGIVHFENGLTATGLIDFEDISTGMILDASAGVVRAHPNGTQEYGFVLRKAE